MKIKPSKLQTLTRCSYCRADDGELSACDGCGTLTHAECLTEHGRCPTLEHAGHDASITVQSYPVHVPPSPLASSTVVYPENAAVDALKKELDHARQERMVLQEKALALQTQAVRAERDRDSLKDAVAEGEKVKAVLQLVNEQNARLEKALADLRAVRDVRPGLGERAVGMAGAVGAALLAIGILARSAGGWVRDWGARTWERSWFRCPYHTWSEWAKEAPVVYGIILVVLAVPGLVLVGLPSVVAYDSIVWKEERLADAVEVRSPEVGDRMVRYWMQATRGVKRVSERPDVAPSAEKTWR